MTLSYYLFEKQKIPSFKYICADTGVLYTVLNELILCGWCVIKYQKKYIKIKQQNSKKINKTCKMPINLKCFTFEYFRPKKWRKKTLDIKKIL